MILYHFNHGPLRVLLNEATGDFVSVQDRISGADARLMYSLAYVARAVASAQLAWGSMYAGAC